MTELDLKLIEIQNLYQEKKDIMSENFRMAQEVQNMRFMLQDRQSLISRLQFKLEQSNNDRSNDVQDGLSNNMSRMDRSISPQPPPNRSTNKENLSPSPMKQNIRPPQSILKTKSDVMDLTPSPNIGRKSDNSGSIIRGEKRDGGPSASQKAAEKVRNGLTDLKSKMQAMKEKKEQAEREMLAELEAYQKSQ